jgi:hypothetical protein
MSEHIRFAQFVANALLADDFDVLKSYEGNLYFQSKGRGKILVGDDESFRNSWELHSWKSWFGKRHFTLYRGGDILWDLPADDKFILVPAWDQAMITANKWDQLAKEEKERKLNKLYWYP